MVLSIRFNWEDLDYLLLSRCMPLNKGWGLDELKANVLGYQQRTKSSTPHPEGLSYEVIPPPPLDEDSEMKHCN